MKCNEYGLFIYMVFENTIGYYYKAFAIEFYIHHLWVYKSVRSAFYFEYLRFFPINFENEKVKSTFSRKIIPIGTGPPWKISPSKVEEVSFFFQLLIHPFLPLLFFY